jgi:hypothetical protein
MIDMHIAKLVWAFYQILIAVSLLRGWRQTPLADLDCPTVADFLLICRYRLLHDFGFH